jgi:hypothetical protein
MRGKGIGVVAWRAQGGGSVADEAADPLYFPLRMFSPLHVVLQRCGYDPVKGPSHVEQ